MIVLEMRPSSPIIVLESDLSVNQEFFSELLTFESGGNNIIN